MLSCHIPTLPRLDNNYNDLKSYSPQQYSLKNFCSGNVPETKRKHLLTFAIFLSNTAENTTNIVNIRFQKYYGKNRVPTHRVVMFFPHNSRFHGKSEHFSYVT